MGKREEARRKAQQEEDDARRVQAMRLHIERMRHLALLPENLIDATAGETLLEKVGHVDTLDGGWVDAPLKLHLAYKAHLPSWPTTLLFMFTRERVKDGANLEGDPKVIQRLSITWHIPYLAVTEVLRPLKDELISMFVPRELLGWFFPEGGDLICLIRAGEPLEGRGGQVLTPVTLHFYLDEAAPTPEAQSPDLSEAKPGDLVPVQLRIRSGDGAERIIETTGRVLSPEAEEGRG